MKIPKTFRCMRCDQKVDYRKGAWIAANAAEKLHGVDSIKVCRQCKKMDDTRPDDDALFFPKERKTEAFVYRMTPKVRKELERVAKKHGHPMNDVIEIALERFFHALGH